MRLRYIYGKKAPGLRASSGLGPFASVSGFLVTVLVCVATCRLVVATIAHTAGTHTSRRLGPSIDHVTNGRSISLGPLDWNVSALASPRSPLRAFFGACGGGVVNEQAKLENY